MSTQRRSDFCLQCIPSEEDCAVINKQPELSLCGQTPFTLSVSFYPKYIHSSGILVKQKGGFELGYKNGAVYFAVHDQDAYVSDAAGTPLRENAWNRVALVYSDGKLKMFVNNVCVLDGAVANKNQGQSGEPYQAGIFDGYLRNIQLLDFAVDQEKVTILPYIQLFTDKKALLNVDFEAYTPVDDGEAKASIQLTGRCGTVNIVQALCPGRLGFAALRSKINPGGFDTGAFTIIAKIYATEPDGSGIIFSNGEAEEEDSVALGIENLCPVFMLGNQKYIFTDKIPVEQWCDLAVTLDQTKTAFYIDGKPAGEYELAQAFKRESRADILIGNRYINGETANGFTGYIDGVSVFDIALGQKKIEDYANVAPYYYDAHLSLLCIFSENGFQELKSGASYSFGKDADAAFRFNTVREQMILPMLFHMDQGEGTHEFDEVTKWKLTMVAQTMAAVASRLKAPSESEPFNSNEEFNPALLGRLYDNVGETEEFQQLSEEKETYSPEKMGAIIGASGLLFTSILMFPAAAYARWRPAEGLTEVGTVNRNEYEARPRNRRDPGQRMQRDRSQYRELRNQGGTAGETGAGEAGGASGGAGGGAAGGAAGGAGAGAAGGAAAGGAAAEEAYKNAYIASGITLMAVVAATSCLPEIKKDDMPAPAVLKSISFYRHQAQNQGALPPVNNYRDDQAEWSDKKENYPALYCQNVMSSSGITLLAVLSLPEKKRPQAVGVSVKETTTGTKVFGDGHSVEMTPRDGSFLAKITMDDPKLGSIEPGKYQVRLTWSLLLKDGKSESLGASSHTVRVISAQLETISFYGKEEEKAGALFAKPDFDVQPILPEWKRGREPGGVLYHKQGVGNPHIAVTVTVRGAGNLGLTYALKANNQADAVLGTPVTTGSCNGTEETVMGCELTEHQLASASAGQYRTKWDWKISINGSQDIGIGTAELETHILNGPPLLPWSMDESKGLQPVYQAIRQCEEVLKIQSGKAAPADERYADQFVRWAFECGKWKESPNADYEQFTRWDRYGYNLSLDANRITKCLAAEKNFILGNQDVCSLMLLWARLHGFDKLDMLKLSVTDDYDLLFLNKVIPLGGSGDAKEVVKKIHYCIVKRNEQEFHKSLIWDGTYALPSGAEKKLISAMAYSEYKEIDGYVRKTENPQCYLESLFQYGFRCYAHACIHRIFIEEFNPFVRAIRPGREDERYPVYRTASQRDFDPITKQAFHLDPYDERCHRLSYYSMEQIIVIVINGALIGPRYTWENFVNFMRTLIKAVYIDQQLYSVYQSRHNTPPISPELYQRVDYTFNILACEYEEMLQTGWSDDLDARGRLAASATEFIRCLNSSISNLRIGSSDWNHSIRECYDPVSWIHVNICPECACVDCSSDRLTTKPINIEYFLQSLGQGLQAMGQNIQGIGNLRGVGFYLTDEIDNIMISTLKKLPEELFTSIGIKKGEMLMTSSDRETSNKNLHVLYSSNNAWELALYERGESTLEDVFYYDINEAAWKEV